MSEKLKEVEKMIAKVMKKKDLASRTAAIDYMLIVATGRLAALWRYDDSLPEGKTTKGVFALSGRKKPAAKTPKIAPKVEVEASEPKPKAKPKAKRKPKPKADKPKSEQLEIVGAAAE
jgi:hypothetical protein